MEAMLKWIGHYCAPLNWDDEEVKRGVLVVVIISLSIVIMLETFAFLGEKGKNIFWFIMAGVLAADIVGINWILKQGSIKTLKTVAKVLLVISLLMMPVCTIWKTASVKAAADYVEERIESGVTHTVSVGQKKMKLAHVKNGQNLRSKSTHDFRIYEGARDNRGELKTAQPNGGIITFFDLPEEGVDLYINTEKESFLLTYRVSKI